MSDKKNDAKMFKTYYITKGVSKDEYKKLKKMKETAQFLKKDLSMDIIDIQKKIKELKDKMGETYFVVRHRSGIGSFIKLEKDTKIDLKEIKNSILEELKQVRKDNKTNKTKRISETEEVPVSGKVYLDMGSYSKMFKVKRRKRVLQNKKPGDPDYYVGIEIEFISTLNRDQAADLVLDNNLDKFVNLKDDGSIEVEQGFDFRHEANILCKETEVDDVIHKFCTAFSPTSKVNKSCGLHVHIDMRNRNAAVSYHNLVTVLPFLYAMNPIERRTSRFCVKNPNKDLMTSVDNHYQAINKAAYTEHNTLECRIHKGSLNPAKILNWIQILVSCSNLKERMKRRPSSVKGFVKKLNLSESIETYINERVNKFKGDELFKNTNPGEKADEIDVET